MLSTYMINYKYGLDVILYILGAIQLVPAVYFFLYMRDTQGLTTE
jgi:heme/copper-type cytochrome/quinol oxidase subunit 4